MQSYRHNFTRFSREKEWNLKYFHSFRELKSEFSFPFTHFENEKWNENVLRSRSRMKSEMKMPRDRDREVKCRQNSREFSRNKTLAGYWVVHQLHFWYNDTSRSNLLCSAKQIYSADITPPDPISCTVQSANHWSVLQYSVDCSPVRYAKF